MRNPYKCTADGCNRNARVLFRDDKNDPDTWITFDCDLCLQSFCAEHADEVADGAIECHDCLCVRLISN